MTDKVDLPTIAFCTWGASLTEQDLLNNIVRVFMNNIVECKAKRIIVDLKTTEYGENHDVCVAFGDNAGRYIKAGCLVCPSLRQMIEGPNIKQNKTKTWHILNEAAKHLLEVNDGLKNIHVKTPANITVGPKFTDIVLTPEEAQHLKNIKDLLGGGTMVITKGDMKIEVKNEQ